MLILQSRFNAEKNWFRIPTRGAATPVQAIAEMKGAIKNGITTTVVNSSLTVSTYNPPAKNQASLPVLGTNVSEQVAANIKNKYTQTIYDIRKIKGTSGQDVYLVRVMDKGAYRIDYVDENGSAVPK